MPRRFVDIGPVPLTLRQIVNFVICPVLLACVSLLCTADEVRAGLARSPSGPTSRRRFGVDVSRVCQVTILIASAMAGVAAVSAATMALLGLAFTPMDNLTVTADVFHIDIDDRIILGATFDDDATLALLADAGVTGIGGVQYFTNGVDTRTQGIDVTGSWRIPTGERGTLNLTGSVNYTSNEIRHVDSIRRCSATPAPPSRDCWTR